MSSLINKAKGDEKVPHVQKPEASLKGVYIKNLGSDGVQFHGEVSVDNPYSHRLPVCELTYTLKSPDRILASGTMADPGWIEACKATKLEIPFEVPYGSLLGLCGDFRGWDLEYVFDVGLTIGNFTIPLSTNGKLKIPTTAWSQKYLQRIRDILKNFNSNYDS